jgi:hypothetical protein
MVFLFKKMKELQVDNQLDKVWTTGQIRYTLVDAPSKVLKFRGVYSPLSKITKSTLPDQIQCQVA